jgi:dihydroorotase
MAERLTLPGFVDVHVHLREPGDNTSETIANGTRAAMLGGYVMVCDMPNNPGNPTWTVGRLDEKIAIAERGAAIPTYFYAGSQPESNNLEELGGMAEKAVGLKLYGAPTTGNDRDYTARDFEPTVAEWHRVAPDLPILLHAGKDNLEDMIELVADKYKHRMHICHVNDPHEVEVKNQARSRGLDVTCGVCPHHLFKTSHDVIGQGWFARMQPPLATQIKSERLWKQLADGDIEIVESDYAPHSTESKMAAEQENPTGIHDPHHRTCFGVPGIENIGPMMLRQAKLGTISMERLIDAMHAQPLAMLGRTIDDDTGVTWEMGTYRIGEKDILSGSGWTPYIGALATGRVAEVHIGGNRAFPAAH